MKNNGVKRERDKLTVLKPYLLILISVVWLGACSAQPVESKAIADWVQWKNGLNAAYTVGPTAVLKNSDYRYLPTGATVYLNSRDGIVALSTEVGDPSVHIGSFTHNGTTISWQRGDVAPENIPPSGVFDGPFTIDERYAVRASIEHISLEETQARVFLFDDKAEDFTAFKGFDFFPYDPDGVRQSEFIAAKTFEPVILETERGLTKRFFVAGHVSLIIENADYRLPIYTVTDDPTKIDYLFTGFTDETNGISSYGVGRYLEIEGIGNFPPQSVTLDLNRLYNPTCAVSKAYNCPLIPIEIDAAVPFGERYFYE
jgi:uncharacterized protein (DUF1684 family)